MSRGRRFEVGGFAMWGGAALYSLSPWLSIAASVGLIVGGCWMQFRAERRRAGGPIKVTDGKGHELEGKARAKEIQRFIGIATAELAVEQQQDGGEA